MSEKSVAIGSDHAGYDLKEFIKESWKSSPQSVAFMDAGTHSSESVDYPDFAHQVARKVEKGEVQAGILICGSGNGVCMTANKHQGIRAALCWTKELAELARQHNDANILCIPARFISKEAALEMVEVFLSTTFEGGRHANRVAKISC
jgi:ribose 5-phosphate isomerase B